MRGKILVVDDDPTIRWTLELTLKADEYDVTTANDGEAARDMMDREDFDLVLLDVKLPGKSGIDILRELSVTRPELKVILITAFGDVPMAVEAMRLGAFNFIPKPFSPEQITDAVQDAIERQPIELFETLFEDHLHQAEEAMARGEFELALEHARAMMAYGDELSQERPEGYVFAALAMASRGHREEARKFARLALKITPGLPQMRRLLSDMHETA